MKHNCGVQVSLIKRIIGRIKKMRRTDDLEGTPAHSRPDTQPLPLDKEQQQEQDCQKQEEGSASSHIPLSDDAKESNEQDLPYYLFMLTTV